jgi:hypothetical protein
VLLPARSGAFTFRRLAYAPEDDLPRLRRVLYARAMALQWALALVTIALWWWRRRSWGALGLVLPRSAAFAWFTGVAVAVVLFLLWQARRAAANERVLQAVMKKLERVRRMLPHSPGELRSFLALSATAGICEELLYRGFLMSYLGHWLSPLASLFLAAIFFGLGHSYQGPRGVLLTAFVGIVFGGVYLSAGSLLPAMLLHAGGDAHSGLLAHAALRREAAAVSSGASGPPPTP